MHPAHAVRPETGAVEELPDRRALPPGERERVDRRQVLAPSHDEHVAATAAGPQRRPDGLNVLRHVALHADDAHAHRPERCGRGTKGCRAQEANVTPIPRRGVPVVGTLSPERPWGTASQNTEDFKELLDPDSGAPQDRPERARRQRPVKRNSDRPCRVSLMDESVVAARDVLETESQPVKRLQNSTHIGISGEFRHVSHRHHDPDVQGVGRGLSRKVRDHGVLHVLQRVVDAVPVGHEPGQVRRRGDVPSLATLCGLKDDMHDAPSTHHVRSSHGNLGP